MMARLMMSRNYYLPGEPQSEVFLSGKSATAPAAWNSGIEKSTGKYIAFLNSDDTWLGDKLKLQVDFLEKAHPKYPGCATGYFYTCNKWPKDTSYSQAVTRKLERNPVEEYPAPGYHLYVQEGGLS